MDVITFGCRLNGYESDEISKILRDGGYNTEDIVLINSCAVTKEAERQLKQTLRKIRREDVTKKIILTGCASTINSDEYRLMADFIVDNDKKLHPSAYNEILGSVSKITEEELSATNTRAAIITESVTTNVVKRSRAYLQIQNGCNHSCTFCIIPQGRGKNKSVPMGDIYQKVRRLVDEGHNEIVFTGVDITDYGADLPGTPNISQLIKRILHLVPELPRIRLSSVDVSELGDEFLDLFGNEKRIVPYLHLSLQAGDNMILKRMKRRHLREDIFKFCENARLVRPDVVFGADIIAGFPTESEQMFKNTFDLINEVKIPHLHVFPYSERDGTPAARMPQVEKHIRRKRAAILRKLGADILSSHYRSQVGKVVEVIVEGENKGKAADFSSVIFNNNYGVIGSLVKANVISATDSYMLCNTI